jgi:integrase
MPRARTTGSLEWVGDLEAPKPTDHWRCRVWNRGKRQWLKLPPTVRYDQRAKAEKLAHTMAAASRAGRVPLPTAKPAPGASLEGDVTLDAWGALWFQARAEGGKKSTRPDESKWNTWVVPRLGKLAMATITRTELEAWVEWIDRQVRAQRLAWKTAQLAWGLITSAMQTASAGKVKALRVRNDNPSKDVEPPEGGVAKSKVYLYPSEMLALLECELVPLAVRRAYAVTVYADPRAGEVEALHWEDLDLEHETAHVHRAKDPDDGVIRETKGRAARRFTLEPTLLPLLRAMRAERPLDELVFKPWPLHKNRAGQLRAALVTAGVTRADLFANDLTRKHMTFHDLRATGITWRAIRGDEPLRIMHAAGHKDLTTTMAYVREAENVRTGFGDVFPPLPTCLLGAGAAAAESSPGSGSMSRGMSLGRGGNARMAAKQVSRAVRGEGFEPP